MLSEIWPTDLFLERITTAQNGSFAAFISEFTTHTPHKSTHSPTRKTLTVYQLLDPRGTSIETKRQQFSNPRGPVWRASTPTPTRTHNLSSTLTHPHTPSHSLMCTPTNPHPLTHTPTSTHTHTHEHTHTHKLAQTRKQPSYVSRSKQFERGRKIICQKRVITNFSP